MLLLFRSLLRWTERKQYKMEPERETDVERERRKWKKKVFLEKWRFYFKLLTVISFCFAAGHTLDSTVRYGGSTKEGKNENESSPASRLKEEVPDARRVYGKWLYSTVGWGGGSIVKSLSYQRSLSCVLYSSGTMYSKIDIDWSLCLTACRILMARREITKIHFVPLPLFC